MDGPRWVSVYITCSGVAVMGPRGATCVADELVAGFGDGAEVAGARYLIIAGSTSGVPLGGEI